jgi:hypothetical protein
MKKIIFSLIIFLVSFCAFAQERAKTSKEIRKDKRKERITMLETREEEGVIAYRKHSLIGLKLTNDGYGGFIEIGRAKTVRKALLFQLDISERKHPKEVKQFNLNGAGPYVYGKVNFMYPVKIGVQQQYLLGNKGNKNGVSISANVGGGLSIALLRPYLLLFEDSIKKQFYAGLKEDTSRFLSTSNIAGPSLGTGFNKLQVNPGAYVKGAIRFDYGKYNEVVSAIEVGITAEFYSKKIQQMVFSKDNNFFFSAYFSILFGKRK